MPSQPVLPEDILLLVLAARMMRVSRLFYTYGPGAILRQTVTIYSDKELSRFFAFIYAEGTRRLQFVRSLHVALPKPLEEPPDDLDREESVLWFAHRGTDDQSKRELSERRFRSLGAALKEMSHLTSLSVGVFSAEDLVEFLALLSASATWNAESRGLYEILHCFDLDVYTSQLGSVVVDGLAALLRMSNIRQLRIVVGGGGVTILGGAYPNLTAAFVSMPALQSLCMVVDAYGDSELVRELKTVQFQLVSASFNFNIPSRPLIGDTDPGPSDLHPIEVLSHSRNTLEALDFCGWYTHPDIPPDTSIMYPKMRRICLEHASLPLTMAYIHAFPNLAYLQYGMASWKYRNQQPDSSSMQVFDERRRLNMAAQVLSGRTWAHLEELRGRLIDIYMLGHTCTINRLRLYLNLDDPCYQLSPVLSHARPRYLDFPEGELEFSPEDDFNFPQNQPGMLPGLARHVFDALRGTGGSRLESLHTGFDLGHLTQGRTDVDFYAIMEDVASSLSNSPLQDLKLMISLASMDPQRRAEQARVWPPEAERVRPGRTRLPDLGDYPLCPAERSAGDFDLKHWMCSFMERMATLREAEVVLGGPRGRWRRASLASGQVRYEDTA
ncbi:hypothetical protein FKP32DRAFT_1631767 [Trametes sanguinea]|nr:hypothetical protein FKP32DRAFT_1631767 [Trametes sanguinea]